MWFYIISFKASPAMYLLEFVEISAMFQTTFDNAPKSAKIRKTFLIELSQNQII